MARLGWLSRCTSLILIVALTWPLGIAPQQSQVGPFRIFAPYWSESSGFTSTLMVRNIHRQVSMTIIPVLYTNDGREVRLNSLELAPNSVQELSLRELMERQGLQADSGGLALEVVSPGPMAITAHLIVKDVSRGLLFTFPLRGGYGKGETKTLQATWWLRETGDRGTLVLFNTSSESIVVHPTVVSSGVPRELGAVSLAGDEFRGFDFSTILQQNGIQDSMGLLNLRYEGPVHALSPALLMFNEQAGFSLTANFSATGPEDSAEQTVLRAPYVLVNKPDAALGFMREMKFTPYLVMSNTRNANLSVFLKAWFEMPGEAAPRRVDLPVPPLGALETRAVDLSGYVERGLIPAAVSWLSLELSYPGTTDDLAVRIFSVDRDGDDVFSTEVLHHASVRYDAIFWDIRDEEQTLFSLRNVTNEPLDVRVTLSYNNGQGRYKLPVISIPPQSTHLVNLKQVLASAPPDEDGNVLPPEAKFGAAKIDPADGKSVPRLVALAAVFDPLTGMCGGFLIPCVGVIGTELIADPTIGIVGSSSSISAWAYWNDGSTTDESWQTSFDSSDSSIVAAYSGGGVDFVGVGSVTIDGFTPVPQGDDRDPYYCPIVVFVAFAGGESNPPPTAEVTSAEACTDSIQTTLSPNTLSGSFKLEYLSAGGTARTLVGPVNRSGGQYSDSFNLANLVNGDQLRTIRATWTVLTTTATGTRSYAIDVLGDYRITCYNTPLESENAGSAVNAGTATSSCAWSSRSFIDTFLDKVNLNGSGVDSAGTEIQLERFCQSPPPTSPSYCSRITPFNCERYRRPGSITTSCQSAPVAGDTVARRPGHPSLSCGNRVVVQGYGCRTVQDEGGGLQVAQLDFYQGRGDAVCSGWPNPTRKVIVIR